MKKFLLALALLFVAPAYANASFEAFANRMHEEHQIDREMVLGLLNNTQPNEDILAKFHRPATSMPFDRFEALILNERRIDNGVQFMLDNAQTLARAEAEFGVPANVITAIIGIETNYGGNIGNHRAVEALITLGFYAKRRQNYFRYELEHLLINARDLGWDLQTIVSSYAGAIGIGQFMPSNIKKFAVDFDGDGKVDLITNKIDAIGSVANYLKQHGWKPKTLIATKTKLKGPKKDTFVLRTLPGPEPIRFKTETNYKVIKRYNPSDNYAMTVFILSEKIKERAAQPVADVDRSI